MTDPIFHPAAPVQSTTIVVADEHARDGFRDHCRGHDSVLRDVRSNHIRPSRVFVFSLTHAYATHSRVRNLVRRVRERERRAVGEERDDRDDPIRVYVIPHGLDSFGGVTEDDEGVTERRRLQDLLP